MELQIQVTKLRSANDEKVEIARSQPESEEGIVLDANSAACRLHAMDREDLLGSQVLDLAPEEDINLKADLAAMWSLLVRASDDPGDPFRTPALATIGNAGPSVRTVVLRDVIAGLGRLVCYSDRRSPKIADLRQNPRAEWLFYNPAKKKYAPQACPRFTSATISLAKPGGAFRCQTEPITARANRLAQHSLLVNHRFRPPGKAHFPPSNNLELVSPISRSSRPRSQASTG